MISRANVILALVFIAGMIAWTPSVQSMGSDDAHIREVGAQEVISKIKNGDPVEYDCITLIGDLDLRRSDGRVPGAIKITNSTIKGNISAREIVFDGRVDLSNSTFEKGACFLDSNFKDRVIFKGSRFCGPLNFSLADLSDSGTFEGAQFMGPADFNYANFDRIASFAGARFMGKATFCLVGFYGVYADFEDAVFDKNTSFESSKFSAYATFERCQFHKAADFHMTQFIDSLAMNDASFNGSANFMRSHLYKEAWFYSDDFSGPADFKNARFDGPSYFGGCTFREPARFTNCGFEGASNFSSTRFCDGLDLNGTSINILLMSNASFDNSSKIFLQGSVIRQMMVRWADLKDYICFDPSAYLALINNYRAMGMGSDANDCYYDYRSLSRASKGMGLSKFLDTIAWISCGYGVRPHYALFLGLCIIIIFALIFWAGHGHEDLMMIRGWPSIVAALYYSVVAFTANGKGLQWSGRYKYLGVIEGILGWLVMALFLVTLARIMIG